ncbi:hypothetical protein ANO14919_124840 [Xylariales sp. No.14919]|nr:hypothetical protein ANO14919_124840 [Xylariales sp. No.14919]
MMKEGIEIGIATAAITAVIKGGGAALEALTTGGTANGIEIGTGIETIAVASAP